MSARCLRLAVTLGMGTVLAACGGGSGGSSGSDPISGLPSDVEGADPEYLDSLRQQNAILESLVGERPDNLPTEVGATYTGFGTIFDSSLTSADNTIASLRDRALVTSARAEVDFDTASITVWQEEFKDIEGNTVEGDAKWTSTAFNGGVFAAEVEGKIGEQSFKSRASKTEINYFDTGGGNSSIVGIFEDAPLSGSGSFEGSRVSGNIAATSD